jgi:hypothetical protein
VLCMRCCGWLGACVCGCLGRETNVPHYCGGSLFLVWDACMLHAFEMLAARAA